MKLYVFLPGHSKNLFNTNRYEVHALGAAPGEGQGRKPPPWKHPEGALGPKGSNALSQMVYGSQVCRWTYRRAGLIRRLTLVLSRAVNRLPRTRKISHSRSSKFPF